MQKIRKLLNNEYFNYIFWLLLVFLSFFTIDYITRYACMLYIDCLNVQNIYATYFSIFWIIILSLILIFLPKKVGKRVYIILISIFSIYAFALLTHLSILGRTFNVYDLFSAGEGLTYFSDILNHLNPYAFLIIFLSIILCGVALKLWPEIRLENHALASIFVIAICLGCACKTNAQYYLNDTAATEEWNSYEEAKFIYERFSNPTSSLEVSGLYEFIYRDLTLYLKKDKAISQDEVNEITSYLKSRKLTKENNHTGIFEGKNVIMIMMESVDNTYLNKDVMPTLNSLKSKSLYFKNRYSPIYGIGATFNSEFTSLTGTYSSTEGMAAYFYTNNNYQYSLPNLFKENGYKVNSFHMNDGKFYDRSIMHKQFGFAKYNSFKDYTGKYIRTDSEILDYDNIYQAIAPDEPFFSFIVTYSAHLPYTSENEVCQNKMQDKFYNKDDYETSCLKSTLYDTDTFINKLITKLKSDNKLDDTVIILYGDHLAYSYSKRIQMGGNENYNLNKGVYMIYNSKITPEEIDTLNTTIDMVPTILNLFDLKGYDPNNYLGIDTFNKKANHIVYFSDYNWYDGKTYSGNLSKKDYLNNKKYVDNMNDYVANLIDYDNKIVMHDYYKYKEYVIRRN